MGIAVPRHVGDLVVLHSLSEVCMVERGFCDRSAVRKRSKIFETAFDRLCLNNNRKKNSRSPAAIGTVKKKKQIILYYDRCCGKFSR